MPASSELIKKTVNNLLDYINNSNGVPMVLPSERILSTKLEVSRTTLIKAFNDLQQKNILRQDNHALLVLKYPEKSDYYDQADITVTKTQAVENFILEQFSNNELKPGDRFSELQIAKKIKANTVTVREVLLKISRTGLIVKKPRQKWEVISISSDSVNEINEYRELLETHGLKQLLATEGKYTADHKNHYERLLENHLSLQKLKKIKREKIDQLENDFHMGIISHTKNRFIKDDYDSLFFVIRFHLGHHNMTETRFRCVLEEHIKVIENIIEGDFKKSAAALSQHFYESRKFFFKANNWPFK